MQIQLFTIPITDEGQALVALNKFLAGHKILEVEQHFFANDKGGVWCFCIRHLAGGAAMPAFPVVKVDYKTLLTEAEFIVFSKLREIRKQLAVADAVPAYAIFTDEELANICRLPEITATQIQTIKGIAAKRVEKYGNSFIKMFDETK